MMLRGGLLLLSTLAPTAAAVRRVLVTGANKGIGKAIVSKILSEHSDVHVLLGSRDEARGERAVEQILESVPSSTGRISFLRLDVTSDESVEAAAKQVASAYPDPLYGVVNNAGVGFGRGFAETLAVNMYGPRRVCDAFIPLLDPKAGRLVNIASASGPNYVRGLDAEKTKFFTSETTSWEELEAEMARVTGLADYENSAYGFSKACLNVYTMQLARQHPKLRINSCSPGYILTDLTAGMGATTPPEKSNCHVAPLFLLFGEPEGNGRYYGSDAVRSPLYKYRGPGDPPYMGD